VKTPRPLAAAAAPLVIRPQSAPLHFPGNSSMAISRSAHICAIHSDVELRGTALFSISSREGVCASNTKGTPPYSLTNSKYCQARQKNICPFNLFLAFSSISYLSTSVKNILICLNLVHVLLPTLFPIRWPKYLLT